MAAPDAILLTDSSNGTTPGRIEGGAFGVTPDGAATFTLPLWVPLGRRGIQPELTLRYHSRGANGLLGVGWTLTGISQIMRSRKTIVDDGVEGPVLFNHTDPFTLDGERLVLVNGTHGVDGAEYRTRHDTFTKIILHDVDSAPNGTVLGPTWFEAFHKDGRIFVFGGIGAGDLGSRFEGVAQRFTPVPVGPGASERTAQDSVIVSNVPVRFAWSLCSIRDRSGNTLLIHYDGPPYTSGAPIPSRDYLPMRIEYVGSQVDETPALRSVDFIWEDRPDPEVRLLSGLRIPQHKRLRELRMSGPDPTSLDPSHTGLLRRYEFMYQNNSVSNRSLLTSVQEYDRFGVAKGPHTFEWETGQSTFHEIDTGIKDVKTTPEGFSPLPGRIRVADFDGDGRDDILYVPAYDANQFYILLADDTSPTGFSAPYPTGIPVPHDSLYGRVFVFPDAAGDWMNILVRDDSAQPGTTGSPTYRVYHAGIDRSGASGNIGSFWVFPGKPIFNPAGSVEGPVELADINGDALPDLIHGYTGGGGPNPLWYERTNLGGNLNFSSTEQLIGDFPLDPHAYVNLDGGITAALLIDDSLSTGGDPRYSTLRLHHQGTNITKSVGLTTLLRDQQYVFGDFTGSGLPSAFSLGNADRSDPSLAENIGGSFAPRIPFVLNLSLPGSWWIPALRVFDWNQDGRAEVLARTGTVVQQKDPMFALRWNGAGFTQNPLPLSSTWMFPEELDVFEVFDYNGDGLDDIVMYNDGHLRVYVREGKKADMLTAIVDGLGARTTITYAPISDRTVHTPAAGFTYPQRAAVAHIWVVAEYQDDNGIGGVHTYRYQYHGGVQDITGEGFLGFSARDTVHVETGITTHTIYAPFTLVNRFYPLLGLPIEEVTRVPLPNGIEHFTTRFFTYAVRPNPSKAPFFVFPKTIVEEENEYENGTATMPTKRRTITQDMDGYGNTTQYDEVWSDGNHYRYTATFLNTATTWLVGLMETLHEQSTTPNGITQARSHAYEYDSQGLLAREIIEPGLKGPLGYTPLGPQADGVKTLFRSIDRYPNGNEYRIVEEEMLGPTGLKRSVTFTYDDLEHIFPSGVENDLGHHMRAVYHPGLGLTTMFEDENGVQQSRQYDGLGRLRQEASPDGNHLTVHYLVAGGNLRVTREQAAGTRLMADYDVLGRVVSEARYARDDGAATVQEIKYDELGQVAAVSRPRFDGASPVYDTFSYDLLGRLTAKTGADGSNSTISYRGEWIHVEDSYQHATALRVDNLNRVIFSTDRDAALVGSTPGPAGTTFQYGPFGTLKTVTDIVGNVTDTTYDRLGRVIHLQDPDRGQFRYRYNAFGDMVQEIKGNNHVVTYNYDAIGRLYWIQDTIDEDIHYTWDTAVLGIGKIAQIAVSGTGITTTYSYDSADRLTTKALKMGPQAYEITKTFDAVGRLEAIVYPSVGAQPPFTVKYEYGNFGQLLRAVDSTTNHVYWESLESDASGLFGREELGNGLVDVWIGDIDRPGVLKSIQTRDSQRKLLRDVTLEFDLNSNVKSRNDRVLGTKEGFGYDHLNRLHRWTWEGTAGLRRVRWDYDDIGNILLRAVEAGPGTNLAYTYNPSIAGPHAVVATTLGAYQYDAKGNQVGAPGRMVTYGRQDLPIQVQRTTGKTPGAVKFLYDGETARVRTIDEVAGLTVDTVAGLYEYHRPNGTPGLDGMHVFVIYASGRPIARRVWRLTQSVLADDHVEYLHLDHQGSVELVTRASGKPLERFKYDPFGRRVSVQDPTKRPSSLPTELQTGFTGHEHVDGWELIDMRGRFYDPILAKFLSPDPFVPRPLNPQSWNRYSYVMNNPVSLVDPTGFQDDDDDPELKGTFSSKGQTVTFPADRIVGKVPTSTSQTGTSAGGKSAEPSGNHTVHPPPPPPKNDDGLGGATLSSLPANAGIRSGSRGASNDAAKDPAELLFRFAREPARRVEQNAPFANAQWAAFHTSTPTSRSTSGSRSVREWFGDMLFKFSQQEGLANAIAGFGDDLSFGVTGWIRGEDGIVDDASGWYVTGAWIGVVWGTIIAGGTNEALNRSRSWFSTNIFRWGHGEWGVRVIKKMEKVMMNPRPHFHLGPGKLLMELHLPYERADWFKRAGGLLWNSLRRLVD